MCKCVNVQMDAELENCMLDQQHFLAFAHLHIRTFAHLPKTLAL